MQQQHCNVEKTMVSQVLPVLLILPVLLVLQVQLGSCWSCRGLESLAGIKQVLPVLLRSSWSCWGLANLAGSCRSSWALANRILTVLPGSCQPCCVLQVLPESFCICLTTDKLQQQTYLHNLNKFIYSRPMQSFQLNPCHSHRAMVWWWRPKSLKTQISSSFYCSQRQRHAAHSRPDLPKM